MTNATLNDLKARCKALGHRLLDDGDELENRTYYVELPSKGQIVAYGDRKAIIDWIETEEDVRSDTAEVLATSNSNEPQAKTFSESIEGELADIKRIITEIDHLAHDGQRSNDPTMTLAVIERLARDASSVLYGDFRDTLTAGLKRGWPSWRRGVPDGGAR